MKFILILLALALANVTQAQRKLVVSQPYNGSISYNNNAAISIKSVEELPPAIKKNLEGYLQNSLGDFYPGLKFSHGVHVDLKKHFSGDTTAYRFQWIVPDYDLNFVLRDTSVGILSYYVNVHMNGHGQILSANWPREHYGQKKQLQKTNAIEQYALEIAKKRGFDTGNYEAEFLYIRKIDKLVWRFHFPAAPDPNSRNKNFNSIDIDWAHLNVLDEYQTRRSVVN